jgi:flagellar assembly protein FliH
MDPLIPHVDSAARSLSGWQSAILFDDDFDAQVAVTDFDARVGVTVIDDLPEEPAAPAITADDIAAARADAYAEGYAAGLARAAADPAEITWQMLSTIADRLDGARRDVGRVTEEGAAEVARSLMGTLVDVLPTASARHAAAELAALMRAVLPGLVREPQVTIRVNPLMSSVVEDTLGTLDPDLVDRVVTVPTGTMLPGDARIAWADGVAMRDTAARWRAIREVLEPLDLLPPTVSGDLPVCEPIVPA